MKRSRFCLGLLALAVATPATAVRLRAQTMTRGVRRFGELETALFEAWHGGDAVVLDRLLAADFEQRDLSRPGQPVARAEWRSAALAQPLPDAELEQFAVHDRGDTAIVSFVAHITGRAAQGLVDVWGRTAGGDWQLLVRYAAMAP